MQLCACVIDTRCTVIAADCGLLGNSHVLLMVGRTVASCMQLGVCCVQSGALCVPSVWMRPHGCWCLATKPLRRQGHTDIAAASATARLRLLIAADDGCCGVTDGATDATDVVCGC